MLPKSFKCSLCRCWFGDCCAHFSCCLFFLSAISRNAILWSHRELARRACILSGPVTLYNRTGEATDIHSVVHTWGIKNRASTHSLACQPTRSFINCTTSGPEFNHEGMPDYQNLYLPCLSRHERAGLTFNKNKFSRSLFGIYSEVLSFAAEAALRLGPRACTTPSYSGNLIHMLSWCMCIYTPCRSARAGARILRVPGIGTGALALLAFEDTRSPNAVHHKEASNPTAFALVLWLQ